MPRRAACASSAAHDALVPARAKALRGHKQRPFSDLVKSWTSGRRAHGPEGENAVARYRELMGPTDSKKAPAGTIRAR